MSHIGKMKLMLVFFLFANFVQAQESLSPFWEDIKAFKKQDSFSFPQKNAILFIGSSSFTNWKDVQAYFPSHKIINRGFGGSTLLDQIRYVNDIVYPYKPKQIVIYCGENDLASSDTVTSQMVLKRFTTLFNLIRRKFPNVSVVFISLKPSPSRWYLRQKMITANDAIRNFLRNKPKMVFVDVYHKMLGADGKPMKDIFLDDELHMNPKGYAIWQKELKSHLLK